MVNLVSPSEFLRNTADQMRRQRTEVEGARRSQRKLVQTLAEALESLAARGGPPGVRSGLQAVLGGQSRLTSVARRLTRALARCFDLYLFGGILDPAEAEPLQERYRAHYEALRDQPAYDPGFYLLLQAAREAGGVVVSPRAGRVPRDSAGETPDYLRLTLPFGTKAHPEYRGMPLGDLLTSPAGRRFIEYLATRHTPQDAHQEQLVHGARALSAAGLTG